MEESSVGQNGKEVRESQADFWWTFVQCKENSKYKFPTASRISSEKLMKQEACQCGRNRERDRKVIKGKVDVICKHYRAPTHFPYVSDLTKGPVLR
jgi:hypothetical protein